jgi:hypothetical protein
LRSREPQIHDDPSGDGAAALEDFPLNAGAPEAPPARPVAVEPAEVEVVLSDPGAAAPLAARCTAAAADTALVLLVTAIAILAARWTTGRTPSAAGIAWAAAFLVFLSFFAIVPALVLFGRTVGMALADLSVRADQDAAGIDAAEAVRRWLGTLATCACAGVPLIWTVRDAHAPTPADRLSGRALAVD